MGFAPHICGNAWGLGYVKVGIPFEGLGDIPPEDADFPASSGLEGEPASRFPLPTVAALPASLSRAVALRPRGCTPLWNPRRFEANPPNPLRFGAALSPSCGRGTVPATPLPATRSISRPLLY